MTPRAHRLLEMGVGRWGWGDGGGGLSSALLAPRCALSLASGHCARLGALQGFHRLRLCSGQLGPPSSVPQAPKESPDCMVTVGVSQARPLSCPGPFARLQRGLKQPQVVEWAAGPTVRPAQWGPGVGRPALLGTLSFVHGIITALPGPARVSSVSLEPEPWPCLPKCMCVQVKGAQAGPGPLLLPWALTWGRGLPHAPDAGGSCSSGWWGPPVPPWCLWVRHTALIILTCQGKTGQPPCR